MLCGTGGGDTPGAPPTAPPAAEPPERVPVISWPGGLRGGEGVLAPSLAAHHVRGTWECVGGTPPQLRPLPAGGAPSPSSATPLNLAGVWGANTRLRLQVHVWVVGGRRG